MRTVPLCELASLDLFIGRPEVFPESWTSRRTFSLYKNTPRPCSALFFVCTDIRVDFIPVEGETVVARQGDTVFIPKGTRYHVAVEGGTPNCIDTYTVNVELFDEMGETVIPGERIFIPATDRNGTLALHFQILSEAMHDDKRGNLLRVRGELYRLLDALIAATKETPSAYYSIRVGAEALRLEWNRNERIGSYAAMCGVSETYFYRCFRAWSGKSPVEYRNALRLSNAEAMLRNTEMPIGEISEVIGFEDPFYFCRIFAAHFGLSPQKYRAAKRR